MSTYWAERMAKAQDTLTTKSIKRTNEQMKKYYAKTMANCLGHFESTYNKLLLSTTEGKQPTPADLYKLDKYWQMQGQLRQELRKLGERQAALLSKQFEIQFFDIYYSVGIPGLEAFTTIDEHAAKQIIQQIWCADGKSWSERIWTNLNKLQEALEQGLIESVVTGKKTSDLKKLLIEKFNVSFNRADSIVRTEMAHIQTQAARQRYLDYGIQEVEVLVSEDERTCPICASHEGERYSVGANMPVPFHPRCRCCMIPVVE